MRVREVMTATPMTIDPEAPVETAVAVMRERGLRHLPVVSHEGRYLPAAQGGRLRALASCLGEVQVAHVMTWGVVTIGPEAPVAQAAAIMADARVGSLPVVEGKRLVGIVTEHDVLKTLAATLPCVKGADPDTYLW